MTGWVLSKPSPWDVGMDVEAQRNQRMLYGFMLECNVIGAKEAGVNLAHSIKDWLAATNPATAKTEGGFATTGGIDTHSLSLAVDAITPKTGGGK